MREVHACACVWEDGAGAVGHMHTHHRIATAPLGLQVDDASSLTVGEYYETYWRDIDNNFHNHM